MTFFGPAFHFPRGRAPGNAPAVGRPYGSITAASMKVVHIEEFRDSAISSAIGHPAKLGSVSPDDVRMTVVVLAAYEQHPLAIR